MKKYIYAVVIIVAILVVSLVVFNASKPINNDTIRIAFIGPLTGDGVAWGEIEKNTIQLAVDEINANGGVKGKKIEVKYEDGKCEGTTALAAAKKLVEIDGIKILLISCSQEIVPIAPYAEANKVVALTSYASASNISNLGKYIFRNSFTNIDMSKAMATVSIQKGKTAAIISEQSAFASDLRDIFINEYKLAGGTIVDSENYDQGARDFRTQITKIIPLNPSVVVINPNSPGSGIALIKQLRQLGYKGELVGNFFGGSAEVQKTAEAQGMVYVSDPVFSESPLKQKVFNDYKQKYGVTPDLPWPIGARYDAVYILKQAFETVGDNPTDVMNYLHHMPKDFTGILGTYRFNADNANVTNIKPSVAVIKNNTSVLLEK